MNTHIGLGYAPAFPSWLERQARRAVLVVWWAITLQLPKRYALWQRARRIRRLAPITPAWQPILIQQTDPRSIRVPRSVEPTVSVIIPSYGKVEYTLACLASIAANPPTAAIEVIVVDDATPDGSTGCLAVSARHPPGRQSDEPRLSALLQYRRACRQGRIPAAAEQ